MKSLWNEQEASRFNTDLDLRVYTSRLLGREKSLVLHGGGNTSVKIKQENIFGESEDILYVKGSGWDLDTIAKPGFAPVRLAPILRLITLDTLTDPEMVNQLRSNMLNASAPTPSVETILHALLPAKFVDHTHADAIIALTNTPHGQEYIASAFGPQVIIIPYVMPGFALAKRAAEIFSREAQPATRGMILLKHGIFTFGDTAKIAYENMIELVTVAEEFLKAHNAWYISYPEETESIIESSKIDTVDSVAYPANLYYTVAKLRKELAQITKFPVIMTRHSDPNITAFTRHPDLLRLSQQGPATPDHVIRTKRLPMLGRNVAAYKESYEAYYAEQAKQAGNSMTMLDPAPRIILDPELGLCTIGRTAKDAAIAEDIYRQTIEIIRRSEALEAYEALAATDIFQVEYWDLEQAKLSKPNNLPPFTGEIALVTGAASGIGKACVEGLLAKGAAVVGLDLNPQISELFNRPDFKGICVDVTDEQGLGRALAETINAFGGLDILILNAGVFPSSKQVSSLPSVEWQRTMQINVEANLNLLRESYPFLKLAPQSGRVVIIGSKNVPAPGPGAAAYSASKAALTQLGRVTALEWGKDNIRVNLVHPNAVFDTGIWSEDILNSRAKQYGLTVEAYKRNNILQVEVSSRDVATLVVEMCGAAFARTTGAQVPIDGGNDRVI